MRVPDHDDPIRIRWWRPPEGTAWVPFGYVYTSSDWDEYPGLDPELGEQWGTRSPREDWRDCSPPPWNPPFPLQVLIHYPPTAGGGLCSELEGDYLADWVDEDAAWEYGPFFVPSFPLDACFWDFREVSPGVWELTFSGPGGGVMVWQFVGPWDYSGPLTVIRTVNDFGCGAESDEVVIDPVFP